MSHVLNGEKRLDEVIEECFPNIWHISGGTGLLELVSVDEDKLAAALTQMRALDDAADYILIDTGAGLNNNILRMIGASDRTVLVMTSEPTSILDSYVMLKAASMLERKPDICALINKAESEKSALRTYESFSNVVEKHLKCRVDMLGFVPQDDRMTESISSLSPYVVRHPTRALTMRIQAIANQITQYRAEEKKPGGLGNFFSQLLGRGGVTV
jgi:flagellar biosynthesis protein FlhG